MQRRDCEQQEMTAGIEMCEKSDLRLRRIVAHATVAKHMPAEMTGSVLSERQQWEDLKWIELGRTEYHRHRPTAEVRCYGSVLIVMLEEM